MPISTQRQYWAAIGVVEYEESKVDERMTYTPTVRIEDPEGQLLYITKTAQPVIVQGEVVDPIRILVEPV